ncbi:D-alanyl-glycyl endopeptidase-like protein [Trypanosoma cruzi]|uniref:D-alanyl-glycyl endopeptidase-like protein n=1 Tax=Trypanosoma cruzi TaxID=5693 RepID=A0A7J6XH62_TRYCR|nr:D-alanyl-glycyl endopeptidase-like protein [Trypanosoma cruzi]
MRRRSMPAKQQKQRRQEEEEEEEGKKRKRMIEGVELSEDLFEELKEESYTRNMLPHGARMRTSKESCFFAGLPTWFYSLSHFFVALGIWGSITCMVLFLLTTSLRSKKSETSVAKTGGTFLPEGCRKGCDTTFGAILGIVNGVVSYSNCNSSTCTSNLWHPMSSLLAHADYNNENRWNNTNTSGLEWQCVEFARRYWMLRGTPVRATFDSVVGAADIWALNSVRLLDGSKTPLLKYPNGLPRRDGGSAPRAGDLLIYPRQRNDFPFGHVAVVVGVTKNSVLVAEQNWDNKMWPGPYHNHSREIRMLYSPIHDAYNITEEENIIIDGWMRYTT